MKRSSRKKSASRRKKTARARPGGAGKAPGGGAKPRSGAAKPRGRAAKPQSAAARTRVVVLACKWHPLESMENAVADGFALSAGTVVLSVRCTGGITTASILKLFAKELDGVLILGCTEGDCHYFNGSERCREIVSATREILEWSGISPLRLGFALMSGSEGKHFVDALKAYEKELKRVQPKRRKRVA